MINCKELVQNRKNKLKEYDFGDNTMYIVQVGDNQASNSYIKGKMKDCEEVGIKCELKRFSAEIPQFLLVAEIENICEQANCKGVIVQLPPPEHFDVDTILRAVPPHLDIDGLSGTEYVPCTPRGVCSLLEDIEYNLLGKTVCILGKGRTAGLPMLPLLAQKGATVIGCNSKTSHFKRESYMNNSDVVISAVGKKDFVRVEDFSHYPEVIVDIGINRNEEGKLCGDCETGLRDKVELITPVPNGMGLYTRVSLLENFKEACEK